MKVKIIREFVPRALTEGVSFNRYTLFVSLGDGDRVRDRFAAVAMVKTGEDPRGELAKLWRAFADNDEFLSRLPDEANR